MCYFGSHSLLCYHTTSRVDDIIIEHFNNNYTYCPRMILSLLKNNKSLLNDFTKYKKDTSQEQLDFTLKILMYTSNIFNIEKYFNIIKLLINDGANLFDFDYCNIIDEQHYFNEGLYNFNYSYDNYRYLKYESDLIDLLSIHDKIDKIYKEYINNKKVIFLLDYEFTNNNFDYDINLIFLIFSYI